MDALHRAYSSPMELLCRYARAGRLSAFAAGFVRAEQERRQAETEREHERMLWAAYIHSYADKTFSDWKKEVLGSPDRGGGGRDSELTEAGIGSILGRLFPARADLPASPAGAPAERSSGE